MPECIVSCRGYLLETVLTEAVLRDLIAQISNGTIRRPEFEVTIRAASRQVGLLVAAPLYPAEDGSPEGRWCLTHCTRQIDDLACLAERADSSAYQWFVHCGAETELLACCAVSEAAMVRAIGACCQQGSRAASEMWIDAAKAMKLDAPRW